MQALFNALAGLAALMVGIGIVAAIVLSALDAIAGRGWLSRLQSKTPVDVLGDPDPQNALQAKRDADHGRRIVDRSDWHEATSDSASSGGEGGD